MATAVEQRAETVGTWSQDLAWAVGVRPMCGGLKHTDLVWMELCEHYV